MSISKGTILVLVMVWLSSALFAAEPPKNSLIEHSRVKVMKSSRWLYSITDDGKVSIDRLDALKKRRMTLVNGIENLLRSVRSGSSRIELNLRLGRLYMEDYYSNIEKFYLAHSQQAASP